MLEGGGSPSPGGLELERTTLSRNSRRVAVLGSAPLDLPRRRWLPRGDDVRGGLRGLLRFRFRSRRASLLHREQLLFWLDRGRWRGGLRRAQREGRDTRERREQGDVAVHHAAAASKATTRRRRWTTAGATARGRPRPRHRSRRRWPRQRPRRGGKHRRGPAPFCSPARTHTRAKAFSRFF